MNRLKKLWYKILLYYNIYKGNHSIYIGDYYYYMDYDNWTINRTDTMSSSEITLVEDISEDKVIEWIIERRVAKNELNYENMMHEVYDRLK